MKNKVIVFSGNKVFSYDIAQSFLKRGVLDFSIQICENFDDFAVQVKEARGEDVNVISICPNEFVDNLLEKVKLESDNLTLLFEQAVKLENGTLKMLFLPFELEFEKFFDEFLPAGEVSCCSIFGKTYSFIESKLKELNCSYKIITKNMFLHTIYYSATVNEETLKSIFGDSLYSTKDESLACVCGRLLKEKNLSISVAEQISAGGVTNALMIGSEIVTKRSFLLFTEKDFVAVGINADFLETNGIACKETAYQIARKLLLKAESDVIVSVLGDDEKERIFVSVGDEKEIHVFSSAFNCNKTERAELIISFALFILQRFLKNKIGEF